MESRLVRIRNVILIMVVFILCWGDLEVLVGFFINLNWVGCFGFFMKG